MTDPAPFLIDDADLPALRNAIVNIAGAGYCEAGIRQRLGLSDIIDLHWHALPVYRMKQSTVRDELTSAIDLFLMQGAISSDELNRLFEKGVQDALLRAGVLTIDDTGVVRARASLFPVGDCLIFSDHAWPKLPHPGYTRIPYNQVMAVGSDSHWLARTTVRRPVGSTLDLCTGSGVHAILAASHSRRVLAVDINPRAANCTQFNIKASGATNVEIVVGDLYEHLHGERFDLITANPPFVPSPVNSLGFRDGGRSGEDVQRRIVAGLPIHLAPGGIAQIVTELGESDEVSVSDRLRTWLNGAPLDIHILRLRVHSITDYSVAHADGEFDYGVFMDSVHDWADNLRTQGYSRIVSVLLTFQWNDPAFGAPWIRSVDTQPPRAEAGTELETMLRTERLARDPGLYEMIVNGRVSRAGLIRLMEIQTLGSNLNKNTHAELLGQSLPVILKLNPVEREILVLLNEPMGLPDLIMRAGGLNLSTEKIFATVGSLLWRGLFLLNDCRVSV